MPVSRSSPARRRLIPPPTSGQPGTPGTPYAGGLFRLELSIPQRYPFEPPAVRFVTPIYHPNVDTAGRICLDLLKSRPRGTWKPSVSLGALLTSIQLLMAEPNPDDGLLPDVVGAGARAAGRRRGEKGGEGRRRAEGLRWAEKA